MSRTHDLTTNGLQVLKEPETPFEVPMTRIMQGIASPADFHGYLRISLLENCNERCFFCHNEGSTGRTTEISEDIMWPVVDASLALGKKKIKFTGGEPTIHPKLLTYIETIRKKSDTVNIGIVTNALLLEEMAGDLIKAGLNDATVSFHALNPSLYKRITGVDGLTAAVKGMDALQRVGIPITINTVVSTVNFHEVPALYSFAQAHGYGIRLLNILPTTPGMSKAVVTRSTLEQEFPEITLKAATYHPKCNDCTAKPVCGEGEYLRLSASGTLVPCMYREDLMIPVYAHDPTETILRKVALGFRRVHLDDV